MTYQYFDLKKDAGVGIVTMNRPPVNALSADFVQEMQTLVCDMEKDREIRCVLFRSGLEKFFSAGFDLTNFPPDLIQKYTTPEKTLDMKHLILAIMGGINDVLKDVQKAFRMVETMTKPTIAAINGLALGGGLEFALSCDFRWMGKGKIGLTEVGLGLIPLGGGTQRLPRLIGKSKAMAMMLNSEKMEAKEAMLLGIVDQVCDEGKLDEEALAYAKKLAAGATRAISMIKKCVTSGLDATLTEGLKMESDSFEELCQTDDMIEGVMSFIEKRKPNFSGQ